MSDEQTIDEPDTKRWRLGRGLIGAIVLSVLCQGVATWWVVSSLSGNTARIRWPYNELWYAVAVNAPAAIFWFWYFARPRAYRDF